MNAWGYLLIAIVCEVIATSSLKATQEFSKWLPTVVVIVGYIGAFYFLALSLRSLPVGIAYALWAGLGIIAVAAVSWFFYGQKLDLAAIIGIGLILAGVLVLNVFSNSLTR